MKIKHNKKTGQIDFDALIRDLFEEHGNIFFAELNNEIYIYKPLNRKAYKQLVANPNLNQIEKEDEVCKECVLWPQEFDPDECEAGMPSELYAQIMTNSFLTGIDDMITLIQASKEEMEQLDNQMSCIISEAFPSYNIEEIESWDMIKFCNMFAKAEWKLKQFKDFNFDKDIIDILKDISPNNYEEIQNQEPVYEQSKQQPEQQNINSNKVKVGSREMTPDEYRQYQEMQRMFPDIDWGADAMFTGYETQTASNIPTPLRVK